MLAIVRCMGVEKSAVSTAGGTSWRNFTFCLNALLAQAVWQRLRKVQQARDRRRREARCFDRELAENDVQLSQHSTASQLQAVSIAEDQLQAWLQVSAFTLLVQKRRQHHLFPA